MTQATLNHANENERVEAKMAAMHLAQFEALCMGIEQSLRSCPWRQFKAEFAAVRAAGDKDLTCLPAYLLMRVYEAAWLDRPEQNPELACGTDDISF